MIKQLCMAAIALTALGVADAQTSPPQADRAAPAATAPAQPSTPPATNPDQPQAQDRPSSTGNASDSPRRPPGPIPTPYGNGIHTPWAPH